MTKQFKEYTQEQLATLHTHALRLFDYNVETGNLIRKIHTAQRGKVGSIVGGKATRYRYVIFDGRNVPLHHLIWFYHHKEWPKENLKFKDSNFANTKIENLIQQTAQETAVHGKVRASNKSGVKGISWSATENEWQVHVYRDYGTKALGCFPELADAKAALSEFLSNEGSSFQPTLEEKQAAYEKSRRRSLWERMLKSTEGKHGWFSVDQFVDEVGFPLAVNYTLEQIDDTKLLGPGNAHWVAPLFDYTSRDGRIAAAKDDMKKNYSKHRDRWLQENFGITQGIYHEKVIEQDGVCAICLQPETAFRKGKLLPLSVDHNHKTGKVRGLLCTACNIAIGALRDNSNVIHRAADYVDKWKKLHEEPALPDNVIPLKKA